MKLIFSDVFILQISPFKTHNMANRATLIKRAIIVLGSPIALGYILMKATSRDPQKDLAVSAFNKFKNNIIVLASFIDAI